jgi:hypothetical protein
MSPEQKLYPGPSALTFFRAVCATASSPQGFARRKKRYDYFS